MWQLLGVDQLRTREVKNTHALVLKHVAGVRQISGLEACTIVFCLECAALKSNNVAAASRVVLVFVRHRSNLAFESQHILHACERAGLKKWVALQEGAGQSLGWLTVLAGHRTLAIARP